MLLFLLRPLTMLWLILAHLLRAQPNSVTEAAMTTTVDPVETVTRDELLTALHNMNATAKAISRRGHVGLQSDEYKRRHADLDILLDALSEA
ncbi:hypothetical protein [Arthrobacter sp. Alg241-R88]|uniref:hypothetical protein n=1 Tax=Arthrobacter sp. Alg241-R88 TaxID=2305984 RepID=UPI0013D6D2C6|nr:hypothetical protein [Arthrobacter sp. Alg241-R88]